MVPSTLDMEPSTLDPRRKDRLTCDWSRIDSDIIGLVEKMVGGLQKHRLL